MATRRLSTDRDLVLELPTDIRSIERAVEYVMQSCCNCSEQARRLDLNFRVGLTEALSNAMLYGNSHDPSKRVLVEVALQAGRLEARVTDQGPGFDPSTVPDPTTPENLTKPCGRGLFLMRQLLDEVSFNDQGNQVTLVLRLESGGILEGGVQA
ncbi:MAG: ATP-binding protein [Gemmatimonadota bacterium]|nr:ATP-binding protein [Gemmatimonadota bacterium]MDH3423047.1 ATP-binding protein [Gemmatimonadota bacterium]